jgi:hypothetical protein
MDEFQKITPSENILKLRKLTEEICSIESDDEDIINEIKLIIDNATEAILSSKTERTKMKHYENMFLRIKKLIH